MNMRNFTFNKMVYPHISIVMSGASTMKLFQTNGYVTEEVMSTSTFTALTPLHFYLWEHLKDVVYGSKPKLSKNYGKQLKSPAQPSSRNFGRHLPLTVYHSQQCLNTNGGHFEHL
jgi:hypothetical protein